VVAAGGPTSCTGKSTVAAALALALATSEALAALMDSRAADDPDLWEAADKLRDAVGLEERH
jgi:Mrp family chromosome partitioning ATPase